MMKYHYIFGPVPSRRLGRSLGVDLVPPKTCSYDCIFCQLGRTTNKTAELAAYAPAQEILEELKSKLSEIPAPDYITLSGSGEPTLHSQMGDIIRGIRQITAIPIAVITNGSLLWMPEVRRALADADVVLPSLHAGESALFQRINRCAPDISFEAMADGLIRFREEFKGQIWLEVFIMAGINDSDEDIKKVANLTSRIRPDKVQLNTATRPTSEKNVRPVDAQRLHEIAQMFDPPAEVIADYKTANAVFHNEAHIADVLDLIARHPSTAEDVAESMNISSENAERIISNLLAQGLISVDIVGDKIYYKKQI
ncbi:MAG TPA: radical SAM protein [Candidatus Sumerlaeia bacterium]|nr:MAG: molybdenum cofactor biosynthesis protein A [candidate division BRC1 bacterium ADurb.Bin183]HRR31487.1 radical SAM protein [Candidatus Sumerlaeia bacterium]HRR98786.1 radical SAM protein [Candidatus Sumerlaeia bacterium]